MYNDSINGEVKSVPEICVRRDGMCALYWNFLFLFLKLGVYLIGILAYPVLLGLRQKAHTCDC